MLIERVGEEDRKIGRGVMASDMQKMRVNEQDTRDRAKWKYRTRVTDPK